MFVRLLHAAVAMSLASEPAAAPDTAEAPATPASPADEPSTPESDAPAADADTAADEPVPADANAPDSPADEAATEEALADEPPADEPPSDETSEDETETSAATDVATPPPAATEAPRPVRGLPSSGRDNDIVRKALIGGGVASLTLTAGLIGTSAWAWTEHNRAKRAAPNLMDQARLDAEDRQDQMRTIGAVTTAAAVLYGTTGVVLLLLNARDRKQTPRTVLAPNPGGLSLVGRF
ncbi:MAG: hypothetical protein ACRBN8_10900 [Nannocystales bacterium]